MNIWQQNLNKSDAAQQDLSTPSTPNMYDILVLQEPYIDFLGNTHANQRWYPLLPSMYHNNPKKTRTVTFINKGILSSTWQQIRVESQDVVAVSIDTAASLTTIFNIYNDGNHSNSLQALQDTLEVNVQHPRSINPNRMIWAGDFNRHHPMWDEENNSHLFTTNNLDAAQILIDLLADFSMSMALPKDIPTLRATCTKNLTWPNNVFCSSRILGIITQCMTLPGLQPPCTDHFPIATTLDASMEQSPDTLKLNWRMVNWDRVRKHLTTLLNKLPVLTEITMLEDFDSSLTSLTTAINTAVAANVPCYNPSPCTKRRLTKELFQAHSTMRCATRLANNVTDDPSHPSHREYQLQRNTYTNLIRSTKKRHWTDWLEEADDTSIWSINHLISGTSTDGRRTSPIEDNHQHW